MAFLFMEPTTAPLERFLAQTASAVPAALPHVASAATRAPVSSFLLAWWQNLMIFSAQH